MMAKDLDVLPIRAPSAVNEVIKRVADEADIVLADFEAVFRDHHADTVMGKPVFFEHLHPTVPGDYLIASHLTNVIIDEEYLVAKKRLDFNDPSLKRELRIDLSGVSTVRLGRMLRLWPFNLNNEGYQFP